MMSNQVYANMMEISCKQAAGKSICAMPDVCFTPPENPATPPGVPIPYPNTGMASDCTDGSTTVKISEQEVMLKNKSYFKKSTGDEAGCAAKKGVVTSKNMGKVYFNAWSMDIKVEGENVVRNFDITTHNHASVPGNSPTWPYLDDMSSAAKVQACGNEIAAVENNCPNCKKKRPQQDCQKIDSDSTKNSGYKNDPCVKAKRCMLVPYKRGPSKGGCCPGQTPHHIVPKHHFKSFSGYDADEAPCVCVEGWSWHRNDGSSFEPEVKTHPDMHDRQDSAERLFISKVESAISEDKNVESRTAEQAMKYKEARAAGIKAHKETFPDVSPPCSEECMQAQIDAYHQQDEVEVNEEDLVDTTKFGSFGESERAVGIFWRVLARICATIISK
jgi:hypothetical protein